MFCKYCGRQIDDDAQFCPYCGKQLREANDAYTEQRNNKRGTIKKQIGAYDSPSDYKPTAKKKGKKEGKIPIFILTGMFSVIAIVVLSCLHIIRIPIIQNLANKDAEAADQKNTAVGEEEICLENYWNESPDAEGYFEQNSQIIEKISVKDSKDILTEAEVIGVLDERGFKDYPITTVYSMDGKYQDEAVVSNSSETEHPIYETYYVNEKNEYWIITVIEDDVFANPVSINMQPSLKKSMIVSESNTITSYDSGTNQFYKTIPNEMVITVKVVDRIDAKTLEEMTVEAIGK